MRNAVQKTSRTAIILGISLWLLLVGGFLGWTSWQLYQNHLFADHSRVVSALVTRRYMNVTQGRHGPIHTPNLDYCYSVGKVTINCLESVKYDTWARTPYGGSLEVRYLPEDPANHRINSPVEEQVYTTRTQGLVFFSLLVLGVGAGGITFYTHRNWVYRDLVERGIACRGVVSRVDYDLVNKGRTKRYYLVFTFRDSHAHETTGRTWSLRPGQQKNWDQGDPIQVWYNPANTRQFTVDLLPIATNAASAG